MPNRRCSVIPLDVIFGRKRLDRNVISEKENKSKLLRRLNSNITVPKHHNHRYARARANNSFTIKLFYKLPTCFYYTFFHTFIYVPLLFRSIRHTTDFILRTQIMPEHPHSCRQILPNRRIGKRGNGHKSWIIRQRPAIEKF